MQEGLQNDKRGNSENYERSSQFSSLVVLLRLWDLVMRIVFTGTNCSLVNISRIALLGIVTHCLISHSLSDKSLIGMAVH